MVLVFWIVLGGMAFRLIKSLLGSRSDRRLARRNLTREPVTTGAPPRKLERTARRYSDPTLTTLYESSTSVLDWSAYGSTILPNVPAGFDRSSTPRFESETSCTQAITLGCFWEFLLRGRMPSGSGGIRSR